MNTERQPVALRSGIDRPKSTASQRYFLHGQNEDLHEAGVLGTALDLVNGIFGVLQGHHDRATQARVAIEPLLREPIIERPRKRSRHVLAERQAHPVEAVADGNPRMPAVTDLRGKVGGRYCGAPAAATPLRA